jgi:FAD/FMN-containing dehydrogenase
VARSIRDVTHPYGSGGVYANFPDPELSDPARGYYGSNLDRLQVVKRNYDPHRVFCSGPAASLLGAEFRTGLRTNS